MDPSGWSAFVVLEIDVGVYFCDNCWSDQVPIVMRRIIDEVISLTGEITICEV